MIQTLAEWVLEPVFEILHVGEDVGHKKVHQGPKLHHVVLQRRSCKKESTLGVETKKGLPSLTFEVLNILRFIKNHVIPLFPSECKVVLDDQLVGSDANVE